jgi:hypothetical protein
MDWPTFILRLGMVFNLEWADDFLVLRGYVGARSLIKWYSISPPLGVVIWSRYYLESISPLVYDVMWSFYYLDVTCHWSMLI